MYLGNPTPPQDQNFAGTAPDLPNDADTLCAREPITTPGTIQPHGALLVLDPAENFKIAVVSANAHRYFPAFAVAENLFGHDVAELFGPAFDEEMRQRLRVFRLRGVTPGNSLCSFRVPRR